MSDFEKFDMTKHVPVTYGNSTNLAAQASDEPMPCPFCGGAPRVEDDSDDRGNRVIECSGCGASVGANMLPDGWARWNRRATPRATADVERDEVLEDAAKICDAKFEARRASGHPREASAARALAREIRELKYATKGAKP